VVEEQPAIEDLAAVEPSRAGAYCPECGRPWVASIPQLPQTHRAVPWNAVLLGGVGLTLAIFFGSRAFQAPQATVANFRLAVTGGTIALGGIGALIRSSLKVKARSRLWVFALSIWALGEASIVVVCLLVLALVVDLVLIRLSLHLPLDQESLDRIADQVSALFSIVSGA
jgi:hypothetical protein